MSETPNPSGLCFCGCGGTTPLAAGSHFDRNLVKGEHIRYIPGHQNRAKVTPTQERFLAMIKKGEECWLWAGHKTRGGYGQFEGAYAHRMSYELHVGAIPDGLVIDHLCRTPACVNPAHLEAVTQRMNVLRGNSPAAQQARQTHCKRGHEFTPDNTIRQGRKRRCRTCYKAWRRVRSAA